MWVMTIRTRHLAFLDRMVRRHRALGIDIRVTLVAHIRFGDRHGRPRIPADVRVLNVKCLLHVQVGVGIVAVCTSDSITGMARRMPGHGR